MADQTRAHAKANGLKTYTPPRPCRRCGTRLRNTQKGECVECAINRARERGHRGEPALKGLQRVRPSRLDDVRFSAIDLTGIALTATPKHPHQETAPTVIASMTADGAEIYLSLNGQRIAKCEVQTETWITLVPGWHVSVLDAVLVIEHEDGRRFVSQMESASLH